MINNDKPIHLSTWTMIPEDLKEYILEFLPVSEAILAVISNKFDLNQHYEKTMYRFFEEKNRHFKQFISADNTNFSLHSDNSLHAWSLNNKGQLTYTHDKSSNQPQKFDSEVFKNKKIKLVRSYKGYHIALSEDGTLFSWGKINPGREYSFIQENPQLIDKKYFNNHNIESAYLIWGDLCSEYPIIIAQCENDEVYLYSDISLYNYDIKKSARIHTDQNFKCIINFNNKHYIMFNDGIVRHLDTHTMFRTNEPPRFLETRDIIDNEFPIPQSSNINDIMDNFLLYRSRNDIFFNKDWLTVFSSEAKQLVDAYINSDRSTKNFLQNNPIEMIYKEVIDEERLNTLPETCTKLPCKVKSILDFYLKLNKQFKDYTQDRAIKSIYQFKDQVIISCENNFVYSCSISDFVNKQKNLFQRLPLELSGSLVNIIKHKKKSSSNMLFKNSLFSTNVIPRRGHNLDSTQFELRDDQKQYQV